MVDAERQRPTIASAMRDFWIAMRPRLQSEYERVWLASDDDHVQALATKFFLRARRFRWLAILVLMVAFTFVGIGIAVFLLPTRFADVGDAEQQVSEAHGQIRAIREEIARTTSQHARARDLRNLYGLFYSLSRQVDGYIPRSSQIQGNPAYELLLRYATTLAAQLNQPDPVSVIVPFGRLQHYRDEPDAAEIPGDVLSAAKSLFVSASLDPASLHRALMNLNESVGTETEADNVTRLKSFLEPTSRQLELARADADRLKMLLDVLNRRSLELEQEVQAAGETITGSLLNVQRQGVTYGSLESWLPVLSIRVGIVVLLLYVTKVLLATYRYTLQLAAYYSARGDALQMASHQMADRLLDTQELSVLIPLLSPDQYEVEKIVPPYEAIAKSASHK